MRGLAWLRRTRFDEEPEGEHGRGLYTESIARLRKFLQMRRCVSR